MPGPQKIPRPPNARPGRPAPWVDGGWDGPVSLDAVRAALGSIGPAQPWPDTDGTPAAVLVCLFEERGEARVILTRRAATLRSHTGEVAFPGGRLDPGEAPLAAALREAAEEVGIVAGHVEILGQLPPLTTLSGQSVITPFVGVLDHRPHLHPNPDEVERAFDVALSDLLVAHREERWDTQFADDRPMHFFELDDDTVWGATARMLHELLVLVVGG